MLISEVLGKSHEAYSTLGKILVEVLSAPCTHGVEHAISVSGRHGTCAWPRRAVSKRIKAEVLRLITYSG
jgi:hypothetical protein